MMKRLGVDRAHSIVDRCDDGKAARRPILVTALSELPM